MKGHFGNYAKMITSLSFLCRVASDNRATAIKFISVPVHIVVQMAVIVKSVDMGLLGNAIRIVNFVTE
jgi:uncharacterized membrane protein YGL010W